MKANEGLPQRAYRLTCLCGTPGDVGPSTDQIQTREVSTMNWDMMCGRVVAGLILELCILLLLVVVQVRTKASQELKELDDQSTELVAGLAKGKAGPG